MSNASVDALAYDPLTDLLHVATAGGYAKMKGLLVTEKDTEAVYSGLYATGGYLARFDGGSADIEIPSINLREAAEAAMIGHNGGPPLHDPDEADLPEVVTKNATPTVIGTIPVPKGGGGEYVIRTVAREYADGAEMAAYEDVVMAYRPGEGNVALSGASTQRIIREVTASMAVAIDVDTTAQAIRITATGLASKNLRWKPHFKRIG
ncbi:hypothetical protein [Oricola indica]|uniref:hypothetical protein n=1 Tax=Oricola indica TaxID=2872591 RepID=UPI001CBFFE71|nr:hypothetical protein [Oricola indica]